MACAPVPAVSPDLNHGTCWLSSSAMQQGTGRAMLPSRVLVCMQPGPLPPATSAPDAAAGSSGTPSTVAEAEGLGTATRAAGTSGPSMLPLGPRSHPAGAGASDKVSLEAYLGELGAIEQLHSHRGGVRAGPGAGAGQGSNRRRSMSACMPISGTHLHALHAPAQPAQPDVSGHGSFPPASASLAMGAGNEGAAEQHGVSQHGVSQRPVPPHPYILPLTQIARQVHAGADADGAPHSGHQPAQGACAHSCSSSSTDADSGRVWLAWSDGPSLMDVLRSMQPHPSLDTSMRLLLYQVRGVAASAWHSPSPDLIHLGQASAGKDGANCAHTPACQAAPAPVSPLPCPTKQPVHERRASACMPRP